MKDPEEPKPENRFAKKVDSDWKRKVKLEKEKLAAGKAEAPAAPPATSHGHPAATQPPASPPPEPEPEHGLEDRPAVPAGVDMGFLALVQQLAEQAALFMGLIPGYPERNCEQALAMVEMLRALQTKTKGNLSPDESKALTGVVYELQMRYVQSCGGGNV